MSRLSRWWIGLLTAAVLFGCTTEMAPPAVPPGKAPYLKYCALCHGDRGQGYQADSANALSNPHFLAAASDAFLRDGTVRGRPGTPMSAWGKAYGGPLDDQQVTDIIAFLRADSGPPPFQLASIKVGAGVAARGLAAYNVECANCHGKDGNGSNYMSLSNPEFLAAASDAFLRAAIALGRPGTTMPHYSGVLTEQAIDDLVALIRSWQKPVAGAPTQLPPTKLVNPVLHPEGPEPAFASQPGRFLPAADLKSALDAGARMMILDARPPGDYPMFHLPGAQSVPFYAVESYLTQIPQDVWIVAYCACPHAESNAAADVLEQRGYAKVKVLDEGILYWKAQGWPLHSGVEP